MGADVGSVRVRLACPLIYDLPPAHTQRLVHIQSMLKRAPSYRTLELELLEWQERELFEYFVVVSLKKKPSRSTYLPEVSYQFPKVRPSLSSPPRPSSFPLCLLTCLGRKKEPVLILPWRPAPLASLSLAAHRREERASEGAGVGGESTSQCA